MNPRVAIIGCGLVGQKRANALSDSKLVACADKVVERAEVIAGSAPGAEAYDDWERVVARPDVDLVIVSTTHDALAEITMSAVEAGKHVLVEKPAARRAADLDPIMKAARRRGVRVRVGFNHRYHPSLRKALEIVQSGELGELMFIRGSYGHGGRPGYEKEWRANPELSGGGELLDQGVHLIDLSRMFLGDFDKTVGFADTYFWPIPVEDNGFLILRTAASKTAFLHASWTEWKNMFSFEIFGRSGKLHITGMGGTYGVEKLAYYRMLPAMGPPEIEVWEYPGGDESWRVEYSELLEDIRSTRWPVPGLEDARAALEIVESVYKSSSTRRSHH